MSQQAARCMACGGPAAFFGQKSGYTYARCRRCGTIQLSPVPDADDVERAYQASAYANDNSHGQGNPDDVRRSSRPYYNALQQVLERRRIRDAVLDYGAGWGGLVETFRDAGIDCSGLELSRRMVDECQARHLPIRHGDLGSAPIENGSLRAIVMCGVFEHLIDPATFLAQAHQALDDGGLVVSLQPTAPFARLLAGAARAGVRSRELPSAFYVYDPPWHAALYSVPGMAHIVGSHGFELSEVLPAPQGKLRGVTGVVQGMAGLLNHVGWAVVGAAWPLLVAHIFVLRKQR